MSPPTITKTPSSFTTPSLLPHKTSSSLNTSSIRPKIISPTKHAIPTTNIIKITILKYVKKSPIRISRRHKKRSLKNPVIQYIIEKYSAINSHKANSVIDANTGASLEFKHLRKGNDKTLWYTIFANKLGRLLNGVGTRMTTGTNNLRFRRKSDAPSNKKATYGRIVLFTRLQKEEIHYTRLTVALNLLDYHGDTSTSTSNLTTTKIHLNSIISIPYAKFATSAIEKFYLNNILPDSE